MTLLSRIILAALVWIGGTVPGARAAENPPPGLALDESVRNELSVAADGFGAEIARLEEKLLDKAELLGLVPDVRIFHKAVDWALAENQFYRSNDVAQAQRLLEQGRERLKALEQGSAPWLRSTGLVVRGFVSRLDGSVQPYGLVVPASWRSGGAPLRLDVWLHGRDNQLSELKFLTDRQRSAGEFAPPHTLVLHPYGRFCNAFKFAGEIDVLEALEHVRAHYTVDGSRTTLRGFSMGGAGAWHLGAHYPDRWAAVAPGAGFVETPRYSGILERQPDLAWFERRLWSLYDVPSAALNFLNSSVVAYSGELDKQRQAADFMAEALGQSGIHLTHVIGPGVEHRYHPDSKLEIEARLGAILLGRRAMVPPRVVWRTPTLRYPGAFWARLDGIAAHGSWAGFDARLSSSGVEVQTTNATRIRLEFPPGFAPYPSGTRPVVTVDGVRLNAGAVRSDRSWEFVAERNGSIAPRKRSQRTGTPNRRTGTSLAATPSVNPHDSSAFPPSETLEKAWGVSIPGDPIRAGLRKRPGLQGPIDDAFMDSFLFVTPTGTPWHETTGVALRERMGRAFVDWRRQFRGDIRMKPDRDVTAEDLASHHVVLWGDPASNRLLGELLPALPVHWTPTEVGFSGRRFPSASHLPVCIYPNPRNPGRYVVLNSGFTFARRSGASNALQTPLLPDYAILGATDPATDPAPIADAGFFGESWEMEGNGRQTEAR